MVKNKYAQKVLASHNSPAKYPAGSLVTFRANAPSGVRYINGSYLKRNVTLMVVETDAAPVTSAARGSPACRQGVHSDGRGASHYEVPPT